MHRRDFLKGSCGICIALSSGLLVSSILEACTTSLSVVKTSSKNNVVEIPLQSFEKNAFQLVRVNNYNYDLAVQKQTDGTFLALVLMCTHAGHPLTKTGDNYYCTLHGSQFDHEGHVTKGPAEKDLIHLTTQITDNHLLIQLPS